MLVFVLCVFVVLCDVGYMVVDLLFDGDVLIV